MYCGNKPNLNSSALKRLRRSPRLPNRQRLRAFAFHVRFASVKIKFELWACKIQYLCIGVSGLQEIRKVNSDLYTKSKKLGQSLSRSSILTRLEKGVILL